MIPLESRKIILIGFFLVLFGFVMPFLMVIGVVRSTFFWNFASYGASVLGLLLGVVGAAMYAARKKDD